MNTSCGKHRYPDKKAALSAVNLRQRRQPGQRRGKVKHLRTYPCPDCRGWHLTHHHAAPPRRNRCLILRHD